MVTVQALEDASLGLDLGGALQAGQSLHLSGPHLLTCPVGVMPGEASEHIQGDNPW